MLARGGQGQDTGRLARKYRSEEDDPVAPDDRFVAPWAALAYDGSPAAAAQAMRILDAVQIATLPQQGVPSGPDYQQYWISRVRPGLARLWPLPWPGRFDRAGWRTILVSWLLMLLLAALAVLIAILIFRNQPPQSPPPPTGSSVVQQSGSPQSGPPQSGSPQSPATVGIAVFGFARPIGHRVGGRRSRRNPRPDRQPPAKSTLEALVSSTSIKSPEALTSPDEVLRPGRSEGSLVSARELVGRLCAAGPGGAVRRCDHLPRRHFRSRGIRSWSISTSIAAPVPCCLPVATSTIFPGSFSSSTRPSRPSLAVPLALLPTTVVQIGWTAAGAMALVAILHRFGLTGWVLSLAGAAVVYVVEPVVQTLAFGQLGIFLVALVVLDLAPGPRVLPRRLLPEGATDRCCGRDQADTGDLRGLSAPVRKFRAFWVAVITGVVSPWPARP